MTTSSCRPGRTFRRACRRSTTCTGRRQDRRPRRLQQVRDRADDRLRAALQPDGADHTGPDLDRRQRQRHRRWRAWLCRLSVGRLRNQLRRPALELRRALAGAVRSGPEASVPAGLQRRHHARSADGPDCDVRVLPQRLPQHHRPPEHAPHGGELRPVHRSPARSTAAASTSGCRSRVWHRRWPTSTAPATT